jgi:hypothetical protein
MTGYLAPAVDPDSGPFWDAVRKHRLAVPFCRACNRYQFPPRPVCGTCHSSSMDLADVSGRGRVRSWVLTHHVTHPVFAAQVPYAVLFVELAEQPGLVMYGNLRPSAAIPFDGMPVRAQFEDVDSELTLVQWTPDNETPAG